jgi:GT2 family glycosyltransferase
MVGQSIGLDRFLPRVFPPHFMVEWDHATTRSVGQVMGAFLVIRRDLFEELGGFDERFFVYYEDLDLCLRAHRAGWDVLHCAEATARHEGGGTTSQVKGRRLSYLLTSRVLFAAKHFSRAGAVAVISATLLLEPLARLARAALRLSFGEAWQVLQGTLLTWVNLPQVLRRARAAVSGGSAVARPCRH